MSEEKAGPVQWIQDSGGNLTCHVNDGKLNFKQSLIGSLGYQGGSWYATLVDGKSISPDGGFASLQRARNAVEDYFNKHALELGKTSAKIERSYGALPPSEYAHEVGKTPDEIKKGRMAPRVAQTGKY